MVLSAWTQPVGTAPTNNPQSSYWRTRLLCSQLCTLSTLILGEHSETRGSELFHIVSLPCWVLLTAEHQ